MAGISVEIMEDEIDVILRALSGFDDVEVVHSVRERIVLAAVETVDKEE